TADKPAFKSPQGQQSIHPHPNARLMLHKRDVQALAFSPDGSILATGAEKRGGSLLMLATREVKALLPSSDVTRLSFSPDGRTLETSTYGDSVRLWDTGSASLRATLRNRKGLISSVAFGLDGRTVATASLE